MKFISLNKVYILCHRPVFCTLIRVYTILVSERPQTHALDRTATEIG
jgi:hypothetical protein